LRGEPDSPDIDVDSNLGQALSDGVRAAIGAELAGQKKRVEQAVASASEQARAALSSLIAQNGKDIGGMLGSQDKLLSGLGDEITGKLGVKNLPGGIKLPKFGF